MIARNPKNGIIFENGVFFVSEKTLACYKRDAKPCINKQTTLFHYDSAKSPFFVPLIENILFTCALSGIQNDYINTKENKNEMFYDFYLLLTVYLKALIKPSSEGFHQSTAAACSCSWQQ